MVQALQAIVSFTTTQLCSCNMKAAINKGTQRSQCGHVPTKLHLWTLKFEFYIIFICYKIVLFFCFFSQSFKNVKTILNLKSHTKINTESDLVHRFALEEISNRQTVIAQTRTRCFYCITCGILGDKIPIYKYKEPYALEIFSTYI